MEWSTRKRGRRSTLVFHSSLAASCCFLGLHRKLISLQTTARALTPHHDDARAINELVEYVLSPWRQRGGVYKVEVDAALAVNKTQDAACFMVQNINGQLYTVGSADTRPDGPVWNPGRLFRTRRENILQFLQRAVDKKQLLNFEATFCLHDCVVSQSRSTSNSMFGTQYEYTPDPIPAFTVVSCIDSMNIPFPTWDYATGAFSKWQSKIDEIVSEASKHPWNSRKSQAVFRGGQRSCVLYPKVGTREKGVPFYRVLEKDGENAKKCGRNAMLYRALTSDSFRLFNVRLTDGVDVLKFGHKLRKLPDEPRFLRKSVQETFKYQIIAEGECQWANRLRQALFMGTVLIIQDNQCVEYYGLNLRPWQHYIPVDYWFTNLTDAVVWAEKNPDTVVEMNTAKQMYARRYLSPVNVDLYVMELMQRYASMLRYEVLLRPGAVKVD